MSRSLCLVLAILSMFASNLFAYPRPVGKVNDFAHVLDKQTGDNVEDYLARISKDGGPEIGVAIVPNLEGQSPLNYARGLLKEWGIGNSKGGVLILVSMAERQIRVQTNETAAKWLDNDACEFIYADILRPAIRKKNWSDALLGAAQRISESAAGQALQIIKESQVAKEAPVDPLDNEVSIKLVHGAKGGTESVGFEEIAVIGILISVVLFVLVTVWRFSTGGRLEAREKLKTIMLPRVKTQAEVDRLKKMLAKQVAQHKKDNEAKKAKRLAEVKAHKLARFLRKAVKSKIAKMKPEDQVKAHKILRRWKNAPPQDRRWVSSRIPCMHHYVNYQPSNGFGVMDFLFWHWMLFPSTPARSWDDQHYVNQSPSSDYSSSSPSSGWTAPSYGSDNSSGGFSGGDLGSSIGGGDSGGGGGF